MKALLIIGIVMIFVGLLVATLSYYGSKYKSKLENPSMMFAFAGSAVILIWAILSFIVEH